MITFIEENNCIFAVEQNVERNGKFYDELLYCEIKHADNLKPSSATAVSAVLGCHYCIQWEDSWSNVEWFKTLDEAKNHILKNYTKHTAFINGAQFDLE